MMFFRYLIITLLLNFIFIEVYCQANLPTHSPIAIESTTLDTIKLEKKYMTIDVLWLNDTIRVSISRQGEKTDTSSYKQPKNKGYFASKGYFFTNEANIQNCFSYALEKYFENSEDYSQNIFRETTNIDGVSLEKILNNYFKRISEFSTNPRKNLRKPISNDVLLAFVDNTGEIIHAVYYRDEIFYTKNGKLFQPDTFKYLNKFLQKNYGDTKQIIVYKIDDERVKEACAISASGSL
ncbi:hypothetical protein DF185_06755 [Marinifilum breve]|uniref:Uncharacterized protein n=1 Tax=Marinifilum breve TaxID=2184082 RepID=A0A2V4A0S0_9BACT|nr:hypothetical protein [Marinifilum breve]PXY02342.1 hypothetical protein DF185_06755 [Marinifilum breve]